MTCAVVICKESFGMAVGVAVAVARGQFTIGSLAAATMQ
jgi:hypothetical protein